ncbi:mannose-1-phosphate guanylyltransferase [Ornithinimicrobium pratense]|uniref:NTP transferase domain-containing protein n=1 Tax=Ornithinimicrobium pratense TaxID=2593973 RepID=A0A5J6V7Y4_9MICO|nr:mannose-1-phosphate guanylyltransferase [Ornithinimicrobium pratense]QFG69122.1 NTP transferase domain-containing protein [Ornithinimicrobium pratense]
MDTPGDAPRQSGPRGGSERLDGFTAVVPAGGSGTRLWPLSRSDSPKFLHDLTGSGRSLLQATVERLRPLAGDRVMVVTGSRHADSVLAQLPDLAPEHVLVEPGPRDSMPAIGWAAAVLERQDPDAVLGSFAADHVIGDVPAFHGVVRQAVAAARTGALVTLGITPTHPATSFGYIQVGAEAAVPGAPDLRQAEAFVEKPDAQRAADYLAGGAHLWNAGMFVVQARTLLELLEVRHPQMVRTLRDIAADPDLVTSRWESLTRIAIDHAVAEPAAAAGRVRVLPARFAWDDIGDFASLAALLPESDEHPGLRVLGPADHVLSEGSTGVVVAHGGRMVITLGLADVVVVDTPDAVLVTTRERCQDVKAVVAALQERGRGDLT